MGQPAAGESLVIPKPESMYRPAEGQYHSAPAGAAPEGTQPSVGVNSQLLATLQQALLAHAQQAKAQQPTTASYAGAQAAWPQQQPQLQQQQQQAAWPQQSQPQTQQVLPQQTQAAWQPAQVQQSGSWEQGQQQVAQYGQYNQIPAAAPQTNGPQWNPQQQHYRY
jgi:hypothetical protein